MEPSEKSPQLANFLEENFGRTTAITTGHCVGENFGFSDHDFNFRDDLSRKEYTISGLCQTCQDAVFKDED